MDEHINELGISSYGLRDTTLEQIFLRVTSSSGGVNGAEKDTMKPVVGAKTYT